MTDTEILEYIINNENNPDKYPWIVCDKFIGGVIRDYGYFQMGDSLTYTKSREYLLVNRK